MEQGQSINQEPKPEIRKSSFLVSMLSVLLLISVFVAGFFAHKTQNLASEIRKNKIINTPVSTSLPSEKDITENWKSLTNEKLQFSLKIAPIFKYPENIVPEESNSFSNKDGLSGPLEISSKDVLLESTVYTNIDNVSLANVNTSLNSNLNDISSQPFQPIGKIKKIYELDNGGSIFEESPLDNEGATYYISIWKNGENIHVLKMFALLDVLTENRKLFEQMSKTYKFTNESNQIACTADAKICPDGTAVGRSGPKCEFDPCPIPKNITTSPKP